VRANAQFRQGRWAAAHKRRVAVATLINQFISENSPRGTLPAKEQSARTAPEQGLR
jgi:hypothetical protein